MLPPFAKDSYPSAHEDARAAKLHIRSPQTSSPSYELAFTDDAFLCRDDLRPVRLQLELLKPELIQQELGIESTVVVFGSSRILDRPEAQTMLDEARRAAAREPDNAQLERQVEIAKRLLDKSRYYDQARKLAQIISTSRQSGGKCDLVLITGGGPGIMEAANRGAHDVGAKSLGLNIVLPFEQKPNQYITPELCFQFHYFAVRKMHFLMRARALVAFPGGYGTFDEVFETLTLIQTAKVKPVPVLLFGREYWSRAIDFEFLVDEGTISPEDLDIFQYVETAEEAWRAIASFYNLGES
jgi:uncharacterized protein (TIGR00730 family)